MNYDYANVCDIIEHEEILIYGTGAVAQRLIQILKRKSCWSNVKGFVVSCMTGQQNNLENKPVKAIDEVSNENTILIAVHVVLKDEIEARLRALNFKKFVWIYPYLFDLEFGIPKQRNVVIDVEETVKNLYGIYTHAIYYMAIDCYLHKNDDGKKIYIKLMNIFNDPQTSIKRWDNFVEQINVCEREGFKQEHNIKLAETKDVLIDGGHRLILAYYFGVKKINADLYDCDMKHYIEFSGRIPLTDERLEQNFDIEEIKKIKEYYNKTKKSRKEFLGEFYDK